MFSGSMLSSCFRVLRRRHAAIAWRSRVKKHMYCRTAVVNYSDRLKELKEVVGCGDYSKALDIWEREKVLGRIEPAYYSVVMQLCEQLGDVHAAKSLKEDMHRQGWNMDGSCSVHYLRILLSEGLVEEAMQFIATSKMEKDEQFLAEVARVFLECGHAASALEVCNMTRSSSLHVVKLEVLGALKQQASLGWLIKEHYGDLYTAPTEVKLAVANGLSLANQPAEALKVFTDINWGSMTVPLRSVALALESAARVQDWKTAAKIYNLFWKGSTLSVSEKIRVADVEYAVLSRQTLQVVNAAVYLQALALRDNQGSEIGDGDELQSFLRHDFFHGYSTSAYDKHTYEAVMLLCCFRGRASRIADAVICKLLSSFQIPGLASFTSWTHHCGPLHPDAAVRMIFLVTNLHLCICKLELDLDHYAELFNLQYCVDDDVSLKKALVIIRSIRNLMRAKNAPRTTKAYNYGIKAYSRLGHMGAVLTAYKDMINDQIEPDVGTYRFLVESTLQSGSIRHARWSIYILWRLFVKEVPRIKPDTELINKFIECCGVCQEKERAIFFLSVFNDYRLVPNLETFKLLLQIYKAANDMERFSVIKALACRCLPEEAATIDTIAATIDCDN